MGLSIQHVNERLTEFCKLIYITILLNTKDLKTLYYAHGRTKLSSGILGRHDVLEINLPSLNIIQIAEKL